MFCLFALVFAIALVSCGSQTTDSEITTASQPEVEETDDSLALRDNEPVQILTASAGETSQALRAFTYCWTVTDGDVGNGICADGSPRLPLPLLATNNPIRLNYPVSDASLTATGFGPCTPGTFTLDQVSEFDWDLHVHGPAGLHSVQIQGLSEQGDTYYALTVDTSSDQSPILPQGEIRLVDLGLPDVAPHLRVELEEEIANVHVEIEGPESQTFSADMKATEVSGCATRFSLGSEASRLDNTNMGEAPWEHTVTVTTLDGNTYTATATRTKDAPPSEVSDDVHPLDF